MFSFLIFSIFIKRNLKGIAKKHTYMPIKLLFLASSLGEKYLRILDHDTFIFTGSGEIIDYFCPREKQLGSR